VTVKTDCDWLRGRSEAADIDASPLASTSISCCASDFLGDAITFGTAPWAQQSLTAASGSTHNAYLKNVIPFTQCQIKA